MHEQMVKCLRENSGHLDVSKSISDATQSAMVVRLENEISAQRGEQNDREINLNRQIEEYSKSVVELQKENEKLMLQVKDLDWQLNQLKDTNADKKREMAEELNKVRDAAQESYQTKESDLERQRAKLQTEHEMAISELKKLHEQSMKESLQEVHAD